MYSSNFLCALVCAQPAVHVQGQEPLTASMLAAAPPQEQKQMLGKLSNTPPIHTRSSVLLTRINLGLSQ